jgi:hypothetical protein
LLTSISTSLLTRLYGVTEPHNDSIGAMNQSFNSSVFIFRAQVIYAILMIVVVFAYGYGPLEESGYT